MSFQDGKRRFPFTLRQIPRALGRIDGGFLDQQCRQAVAYRIHASTGGAPQRLWIRFHFQVALAGGTDDQIEKVLGNHNRVGLYDDSNAFSPQIHRDTEQGNNITIIASHFARTKYLPKGNLAWSFSVPLCLCDE